METDTLQSATKQARQWGEACAARIWDTYGGRDAGEDEEAQERRVQGAVGADDPEHRPLVGVLEDGADLRSGFVFVSKDSAERTRTLGRAMATNALRHRAKWENGLRQAHRGDGGDRGREQVRVEGDLPGLLSTRGPALALPGWRLVRAGLGPRGDLLLRLARRLARRGQGRLQPPARRRPA